MRALFVTVALLVGSCSGRPAPAPAQPSPTGPAEPPRGHDTFLHHVLEGADVLEHLDLDGGHADSDAEELAIDTCEPGSEPDGQYRTTVKHRSPPRSVPELEAMTPTKFIATYGGVTPCERPCKEPTPFPEEQALQRLQGEVWRINLDEGDCDLHIELADAGAGPEAPRVIVEVPNDPPFTKARHQVDAAVFATTGKHLKVDRALKFKDPIPMGFVGFLFYDGHHWKKADPVVGNGHGTKWVKTLWELHPVVRVEPL